MAHNFRKHINYANGVPNKFVSKAGTSTNDALTPDLPNSHPVNVVAMYSYGPTNVDLGGYSAYTDFRCNLFMGAGHYQGPCENGMPHSLIADGKVVWYVNGNLNFGTKSDGSFPLLVDGISFRFIDLFRSGTSGGGFGAVQTRLIKNCLFEFNSKADVNCPLWGGFAQDANNGSQNVDTSANANCIFRRQNAPRQTYDNCLVFDSVIFDNKRFRNSYSDANTTIELWDSSIAANINLFANNNIRGLIRVRNDSFGFTSIEQFKINYGLTGRTDLVNLDPLFNRAISEDYSLKIASRHLDLSVGPNFLRYALMYYVESDIIAGDLCTVSNTRLRSTADNSVVSFREIGGYTINTSGALLIATNTQNNFEGYYTTNKIPLGVNAKRVKRLPVVGGLNFDTDYPASASNFNSLQPEIFNHDVPDYSNSSASGGRNPNRLTIQARFSILANPDELVNEHWFPSTGGYYDFEIDEQPFYDAVTGYGSGHPLFDPNSVNVRPVLAKFAQIRFKSRNDSFSR